MGGYSTGNIVCMCPSHIPDLLPLLWEKSKGEDEIYIMPGKVIRLGQVLELFNIGIGVFGKGAKTFFNLGEVREREKRGHKPG
jgi:hypothetical protein